MSKVEARSFSRGFKLEVLTSVGGRRRWSSDGIVSSNAPASKG